MRIDYEYFKGILFVRIKGELTIKTSYRLKEYLMDIIKIHGIRYLVYNLFDLKSLDNEGIKSMESIVKAIEMNKGIAYMCEVPKQFENKININNVSNEIGAIEILNI